MSVSALKTPRFSLLVRPTPVTLKKVRDCSQSTALEGKSRDQSAYPEYSLILMVDHYPTQKGKKTDPGFPFLNTAPFSLPYPWGEEEKPRNPYPRCSLILRVFCYPHFRGKKRNPGLDCLQKAGYLITSSQRQGRGPGEEFVKTAIEGVFCLC